MAAVLRLTSCTVPIQRRYLLFLKKEYLDLNTKTRNIERYILMVRVTKKRMGAQISISMSLSRISLYSKNNSKQVHFFLLTYINKYFETSFFTTQHSISTIL